MLHVFRRPKKTSLKNNKSPNQVSSWFFYIKIENLCQGKFVSIVDFFFFLKISKNKNLKLNFLFSHFNKVPRACPKNHYKHLLFATTLNDASKRFFLFKQTIPL